MKKIYIRYNDNYVSCIKWQQTPFGYKLYESTIYGPVALFPNGEIQLAPYYNDKILKPIAWAYEDGTTD